MSGAGVDDVSNSHPTFVRNAHLLQPARPRTIHKKAILSFATQKDAAVVTRNLAMMINRIPQSLSRHLQPSVELKDKVGE
jgi:hypothetical protein